ncbi:unnamed protein product [Prorocentrum cordatum]|uniref:EF-hand domain-containing protein n=1 Tax=Prorocentrum cordatum TaxID=2364126 RepID=A0ABN9RY89_9DINO|nr:unnamed protein product [Polarella glacialis]
MKWPLWSAVAAALGVVQPAKNATPLGADAGRVLRPRWRRAADRAGDRHRRRRVRRARAQRTPVHRPGRGPRQRPARARVRVVSRAVPRGADEGGVHRRGERRAVHLGGRRAVGQTGRPTAAPPGHAGAGGAFHAPYVWHVKDGGLEAPAAVRAKVQGSWSPAYFLRGAANLREANESQEFWFSLQNGSVMVHADTYCIPAVSLQLRGRKQWRLMPAPPRIPSVLDRYDSHDGGLYRTALWRPAYEAERPGSAQAESLAKSLARWKTTPDAARARASAERRFAEVDADGDGALSLQEVQAYLGSPSRRWARWFLTEDYFYDWRPEAPEREAMEREVLESRAGDTLHYHDADADGKVSRAEFVASSRWHVVHHKLKETHGQPRARVREVEERYGRFRGAAAPGARGRDGADL